LLVGWLAAMMFLFGTSQGVMTFGTEWASFLGECSKETAQQIFTEYITAGGNFFDTASLYQAGQSETWLGEFIAQQTLVKREDLVIATKFTGPHPLGHVNLAGNHRKNLVASLDRSLQRLRLEYVDILYVHFFDNTVDALDLMLSLDYVVRSGKASAVLRFVTRDSHPTTCTGAARGH
jgi:aryl-alcohol dehydrogenase-like predicted oxidoreductase